MKVQTKKSDHRTCNYVIAFLKQTQEDLTMKLIEAVAQSPARQVNTKYGQRTVIDAIRRDTGEEVTIWRSGNDEYSAKYVIKNARLTLTLDSKGKYNLVEDPNLVNLGQTLPAEPVPVKPVYDHKIAQNSESEHFFLSPNQKREVAAYIATMRDLYGFCLQQAESLGVSGEDRRAIATTLFLSAQKKFSI